MRRILVLTAAAVLWLGFGSGWARATEIGVEHHLQICDTPRSVVLEGFGFNSDSYKTRLMAYLDTDRLNLYKSKRILRIRLKSSKKADVTVKIRPVENVEVYSRWMGIKGFKCERDVSSVSDKISCSNKQKVEARDVHSHFRGEKPLSELLDENQTELLGISSQLSEKLRVYGPVEGKKYSIRYFNDGAELDFESVVIGPKEVLELSFKTSEAGGRKKLEALKARLSRLGAHLCDNPISKTRAVLEEF